jgi:hypothetical protein
MCLPLRIGGVSRLAVPHRSGRNEDSRGFCEGRGHRPGAFPFPRGTVVVATAIKEVSSGPPHGHW